MADETTFTKEQLDAAIEKAVGPLKASVENLEAKRDELIAENRKLKRGAEIKPEDLEAAEKRADTAEARVKELEGEAKKLAGERDKAVKALETEQGFTQKLLVQDGLKSELIKNGVKDEDFIDTLTAKFSGSAKVVSEGDERKVLLGDKPLADAIKEFAGSDSGKKFVAAPVNGGGGAAGGGGGGNGAKTVTRPEFDAMSQSDRAKFSIDGGKVVDASA